MKENSFKIIIALIFLIAFNALFFILGGTERTQTEWISYGFIHAAYLLLLMTPLFCNADRGQTVLSATLYLHALMYFFLELIVGIGFIWYNPPSITWPAIIQGGMLVIFLVIHLMSVLANDATKASLSKQRKERIYIRSLAEDLHEAMHKVTDPDLRSQIADCYETMNRSTLESFPEAEDAEMALEDAVTNLCTCIEQGDETRVKQSITSVQTAIKKRNRAIKMARHSY